MTTEFARNDLAKTPSSASEPDRVRVIREGVASYLPDIDPEETVGVAGVLRRAAGALGAGAGALSDAAAAGTGRRAARGHPGADLDRLRQHHPDRATSRGSPATRTSSAATARGSGGTRPSWCTARSARASASAATSRPTPRRRRSTRSASTTSSAASRTPAAATRSSSRATPPPASTRAPSSRAGSTADQLDGFRQEHSHAGGGLPSYPHPRLMPDFWEFPTVSMGLGPINAIYQARFNHYLHDRGIKDTSDQHVWAFLGDGEMDEAESRGLIAGAALRGPRQPDLRHQLQPAAPRRPGARQRQDHPGAGVVLPRRRLERHQGGLGPRVGRPAARRHATARWST